MNPTRPLDETARLWKSMWEASIQNARLIQDGSFNALNLILESNNALMERAVQFVGEWNKQTREVHAALWRNFQDKLKEEGRVEK